MSAHITTSRKSKLSLVAAAGVSALALSACSAELSAEELHTALEGFSDTANCDEGLVLSDGETIECETAGGGSASNQGVVELEYVEDRHAIEAHNPEHTSGPTTIWLNEDNQAVDPTETEAGLEAYTYPRDSIPAEELEQAFAELGEAGWTVTEVNTSTNNQEQANLGMTTCEEDLEFTDVDASISCSAFIPESGDRTGVGINRSDENHLSFRMGENRNALIEIDDQGELVLDHEVIAPDPEDREQIDPRTEDPEDDNQGEPMQEDPMQEEPMGTDDEDTDASEEQSEADGVWVMPENHAEAERLAVEQAEALGQRIEQEGHEVLDGPGMPDNVDDMVLLTAAVSSTHDPSIDWNYTQATVRASFMYGDSVGDSGTTMPERPVTAGDESWNSAAECNAEPEVRVEHFEGSEHGHVPVPQAVAEYRWVNGDDGCDLVQPDYQTVYGVDVDEDEASGELEVIMVDETRLEFDEPQVDSLFD